MKTCKAIICAMLALVMILCLGGCKPSTEMVGKWEMVYESEEGTAQLLSNADFYEEEIALCTEIKAYDVRTVEFTEDGNYIFKHDIERTNENLKEFYNECFEALYKGRDTIGAAYEADFTDMTLESFQQMYAEFYSYATYDDLLNGLAENTYVYDNEGGLIEKGTYEVSGNKIVTVQSNNFLEFSIGFEVEGDVMTLTYIDGTEVYTKIG